MKTLRRILGFPIALVWDFITSIRNLFFDTNIFTSQKFDIPIIGVGNLVMGGTGKTPHIEYLIRTFAPHYLPAVMSRGYKRKTQGYIFASTQSTVKQIGDEPLQYKIKHPYIPVAVSESRVLGIPQLLMDAPNTDIILLDDIFQHRAIEPHKMILLTDYNSPYSKDMLFPSGNLREAKRGSKRADTIIVTKCPQNLSKEKANKIAKQLNVKQHQTLYFSSFEYGEPYNFFNPNDRFHNQDAEIVIATGIAKPEYLKAYINSKYKKAFMIDFGDHHLFTERDIYDIQKLYNNLGDATKTIFITEKDAVKFLPFSKLIHSLGLPVYVQPIQVKILFNEQEKLNQELLNFVENFNQS